MLAQAAEQAAVLQGLLWLGVVGGVMLLGVATGLYLRKKSMVAARRSSPSFALEDLRRLLAAGRLTRAEYESLKRKTLDGSSPPSI